MFRTWLFKHILEGIEKMALSLADVAKSAKNLVDTATAAVSLLDVIKTQLDALLAAGSGASQADLQSIVDSLDAETQTLKDAIVRDTPAATGTTQTTALPVLNSDNTPVLNTDGTPLMQVQDADGHWVTPTIDLQGNSVTVH